MSQFLQIPYGARTQYETLFNETFYPYSLQTLIGDTTDYINVHWYVYFRKTEVAVHLGVSDLILIQRVPPKFKGSLRRLEIFSLQNINRKLNLFPNTTIHHFYNKCKLIGCYFITQNNLGENK